MAKLDSDVIRLNWLYRDGLPEPSESESKSFLGVSV